MRKRRIYLFVFFLVLAGLSVALVYNVLRAYEYEERRIVREVNLFIDSAAMDVQAENITLLNNSARMLTDKEIHQKIAFAAGITRNEGKMSVEFGEEKEREKKPGQPEPLNIDKEFIIQHDLKFDTDLVKGVATFDSLLDERLKEQGWDIPYTVKKMVRHDKYLSGSFYSEPFIFDFFDPVMYKTRFEVPADIVLKNILAEIIAGICILLLLVGSFIFFYRSYNLQLQMSSFKESLFSNITHELKSPLTSLQIIIDDAKEDIPISMEHKQYATRELNRMSLLIEKMISFGKMSREQIEMNKVLVDVGIIASDAIDVQEMILKRLGGTISLNAGEKCEVYADKALLTNVFITLLDNALKYNVSTPEIKIGVHTVQNNVVISVTDNGIGISPAFHQKIFEPFFRVPDNDIHNVKGHGLGLGFVKQVVEMHGGSVSVESTTGHGSCFIIKLPKA